jgi:hypothetical protein
LANNIQQTENLPHTEDLNLLNFDISDAVKILKENGIGYEVEGAKKNAVVVGQQFFTDDKGAKKIKLVTASSTGEFKPQKESGTKMPDLKGMSMRKCIKLMSSMGIDYKVNGFGKVSTQSPGPGSVISKGNIVVINCGQSD